MDVKIILVVFAYICTEQLVKGLTCYNCGQDIITNVGQCQIKTDCADGEKCMLKTLVSTIDGRTEYGMRCASTMDCDGIPATSVPQIVGKRRVQTRSLRYDCCSTDFCNVPTTLNKNTTCNRDIEIMLEDSINVTKLDDQELVAFLKATVGQLNIGSQLNQVGLATYDSNIDHKWDLDKYDTQVTLQAAFDRLTFSYHDRNNADIHRLVDFLVDSALKHRNGDRVLVPDTIVIFVDQITHVRLRDSILNEKHLLDNVSRDVILVVVGPYSDSAEITQLYELASSSGHVLHATSYSNLMSIQTQLLSLLCQ